MDMRKNKIIVGKTSLPLDCQISIRGRSSPLSTNDEHIVLALIRTFGFKEIAEIGVGAGNLASRVCRNFHESIDHFFCIDPWIVYGEWFDRPPVDFELDQGFWEDQYRRVTEWAIKFPKIRIIRKYSVKAAKQFEDQSVDLIYLDAIHDFPNLINDTYAWLPKIRSGGILAGHDYMSRFMGYIRGIDFIFGKDFELPQSGDSAWYVKINKARRNRYLRKIKRLYPDPIEILMSENKSMFYKGLPK